MKVLEQMVGQCWSRLGKLSRYWVAPFRCWYKAAGGVGGGTRQVVGIFMDSSVDDARVLKRTLVCAGRPTPISYPIVGSSSQMKPTRMRPLGTARNMKIDVFRPRHGTRVPFRTRSFRSVHKKKSQSSLMWPQCHRLGMVWIHFTGSKHRGRRNPEEITHMEMRWVFVSWFMLDISRVGLVSNLTYNCGIDIVVLFCYTSYVYFTADTALFMSLFLAYRFGFPGNYNEISWDY